MCTVFIIVLLFLLIVMGVHGNSRRILTGDSDMIPFKTFTTKEDFLNFITSQMTNFESSVPPEYDKDIPTRIKCEIHVENFDDISEANMDFTVTILLHLSWYDSRFSKYRFDSIGDGYVELDAKNLDKLWVPDLYFANEKKAYYHDVLMPNKMLRVYRGGNITYSTRLSLTLSCPMNFRNYPFDKQKCNILIESFSYNDGNIVLEWEPTDGDPVVLENDTSLPQFEILGIKTDQFSRVRRGSGNHSTLAVEFILARNIGYYLVQMYIPSVLVVMLSWISFWLNVTAVPGRISLGVLTVLTMTTQSSGVNASLPHVSYTKAIDIWMSTCLMFVFFALIEFAVANVLIRKDTNKTTFQFTKLFSIPRKPKQEDDKYSNNQAHQERSNKWSDDAHDSESGGPLTKRKKVGWGIRWAMYCDVGSRIVFPLLFVIFNICYWSYYLMQLYKPA